jgi:hypothetical protein
VGGEVERLKKIQVICVTEGKGDFGGEQKLRKLVYFRGFCS